MNLYHWFLFVYRMVGHFLNEWAEEPFVQHRKQRAEDQLTKAVNAGKLKVEAVQDATIVQDGD